MTYFAAVAFACACALCATSCGQPEEPASPDEVISFNSLATDSRAVITDNAALQAACSSGDGIGVWGVVNNEFSTDAMLLDNAQLTYNTEWSYTPSRHWVRNSLHEFWALYPYSEDGCVFDVAAGTVTRNNIILGASEANNVDYMCAINSRDLRLPDATTAPVPLEMMHALSLLEFKFVNALGEVRRVTNINLSGLKYKGSITFGKDGSLGGALDGKMDVRVDADSALAAVGIYEGLCSTTPIPKNLSTKHNLFENVGGVIVMPQQVEGKSVLFGLSVESTGGSVANYEINLGIMPPAEWVPGKKYIYTITLTSTNITYDVRVVDWVKDSVELS